MKKIIIALVKSVALGNLITLILSLITGSFEVYLTMSSFISVLLFFYVFSGIKLPENDRYNKFTEAEINHTDLATGEIIAQLKNQNELLKKQQNDQNGTQKK